MKKTIKYALLNSLGTTIYIALVASFLYFVGNNSSSTDKSVFIPIAMLMLLVLSVATVGSLIFGRPILWYLDGKKKESLKLLLWTLGIFLALTIVILSLVMGISTA
jgi:hypothetical protein